MGECQNADPFELSLALLRYGFKVSEIFGTVSERNFIFVKKIGEISPNTKIYSNLSPSMLWYDNDNISDICIGADAKYYHMDIAGIEWNSEVQPFGYYGVERLFEELDNSLEKQRRTENK